MLYILRFFIKLKNFQAEIKDSVWYKKSRVIIMTIAMTSDKSVNDDNNKSNNYNK